jgi:hypothetical protein
MILEGKDIITCAITCLVLLQQVQVSPELWTETQRQAITRAKETKDEQKQ